MHVSQRSGGYYVLLRDCVINGPFWTEEDALSYIDELADEAIIREEESEDAV